MRKNKKKNEGVIYSTNTDFRFDYDSNEETTLSPNEQNLKICIDKHRAGKIAVIVKGFFGSSEDLKTLGKILKTKCGVGGTTKNNEIIIQGDKRDKVIEILSKEGYNYKKVGG